MISLNDIEKVVKKGKILTHVLKGISLTVQPGECFGILGRPGSGKSSLVRSINLLEAPTAGTITIDQMELTALSNEDLRLARRKIGVIFQRLYLLESRTVYENVALSLELIGRKGSQIEAVIRPILSQLNLTDKVDSYPSELTQLQKVMVALARALVMHPKVLLCEEITLALDPKSKQQLLQILKRINHQYELTMVIFTHEIDSVKSLCQRMAVLHQGEIVESGSVFDIYTRPQSAVAKELIKQAARYEIPAALRHQIHTQVQDNHKTIIRVSFEDPSTQESFIAYMAQSFHVNINIIQAHMETFTDQKVGIVILELLGEPEEIKKSLQFLDRKHIHVEVLGYVPRTD